MKILLSFVSNNVISKASMLKLSFSIFGYAPEKREIKMRIKATINHEIRKKDKIKNKLKLKEYSNERLTCNNNMCVLMIKH